MGVLPIELKILHTADLHIGMTFGTRGYPDVVQRQLIEARFESLERIVALATEEKCDLLIIAGDLFHRINVPADQISKAIRILKRFSGVSAFLPGNHDYYEANNRLWVTIKELAYEELILLTQNRPYNLNEFGLEVVLYPAPCDSKHSAENRLAWINDLKQRPPGKWHIGVAHGTIRGISPDFNDEYYPMEEGELSALKLDHWCLGHTHVPYPNLDETGKQPFIYSGTPEPDGFDCRHGGSVWLTKLEDNGSKYSRLVSCGKYFFNELIKEVKGREDLELIKRELAGRASNSLVKLRLRGSMPETDYLERSQLLNSIAELLVYMECDESELAMEISTDIIDSKYPRGSFSHQLLSRLIKIDDQEALQLAYRLMEEVKK